MLYDNMLYPIVIDYIKKNKELIVAYTIIILMNVFSSYYLLPNYTSKLFDAIGNSVNTQNIVIVVTTIYIISILTDLTKKYAEDTIIPDFTRCIREFIYKTVLKTYRADHPVELGKLMNVIRDLPYVIRSITIDIVKLYLPGFIATFVLLIYFLTLDIHIGMLQLLFVISYIGVFYISGKKCIENSRKSEVNFMNLSEKTLDKVMNLDAIYASQQENYEINQFNKSNKENITLYKKTLRDLWKLRCCDEIIIGISFIIFNYIIYKKKIPRDKVIALYVAEIYYFLRILNNIQSNILSLFIQIGEGKAMVNYLKSLGEMRKNSKKNINTCNINQPTLTITNGYYRYNKKSPWILKNFNLKTYIGDKIWIKGDSGCGKTTLFKIILGGLTLEKGSIKICNNDLNNSTRSFISLVDQNSKLFNMSVLKNILYGTKASKKDVVNVLKKLNTNIFDKLEKGLDTLTGVNGNTLSGGQKQLVILLRCYFRDSSIVLMDEPISAIDKDNLKLILDTIEFISKQKTLIIISHQNEIVQIADRIINICN